MKTDICIVGGGLVGLAASLTLSAQERTVKLIETTNLLVAKPATLDARSLALSHSSVQILRSLNLWQRLQSVSSPISHIHVSSAGQFGVTRLDAQSLGLEAMGYVVEYHQLMQLLLERAKEDAHVEIISPASFSGLTRHPDCISLNYQRDGVKKSLKTALLVVADGANSSVRGALGIDAKVLDFNQTAIIANVAINRPVSGTAYERFTPHGPMAMLPLTDQRYSLVWASHPSRAQALIDMPADEFLQELYAHFGYRLGMFSQLGERHQFALRLTRAKQLVAGRCVLIGNAANSLHPVAGQGMNLALRDIAALFDRISNVDLAAEQVYDRLADYQQLRKTDHDQTVRLGNALVRIFSNDLPVLNHARAGALMALDLCPLLKQEFSWLGMGYGSGVSSLMRGVL